MSFSTPGDSFPMRRLPVVLLLDTSGSMRENDKIEVLNECLAEMVRELQVADAGLGVIVLSIVTFGGDSAEVVLENVPVSEVVLSLLQAKGKTPMGSAFSLTKGLIENYEALPSNSFSPTMALVSDGLPTDQGWQNSLTELIESERGAKASRLAVAIGADADIEMLRIFHPGGPWKAKDAAGIREFLRFVTMTIVDPTYLDSTYLPSADGSDFPSVQVNDDF